MRKAGREEKEALSEQASERARDWHTHEMATARSSSEANANTRTLGVSTLMVVQRATSMCCDEDVACMSRNE